MELDEVDADDVEEPQLVAEYACDIVRLWQSRETKFAVAPNYMSNQVEITQKMRKTLIDWLVEVQIKFKLSGETLHLSVNLIDRFLAVKTVARAKLQLVGMTALLVASKYQEIYAPEVKDFIYISDCAYSKDQILRMEELLLNTLAFQVTTPSSLAFAQRWIKVVGQHGNKEFEMLVKYVLELALLDYGMLQYRPSQIGVAAVNFALSLCNLMDVGSELSRHSRYSHHDVADCTRHVTELCRTAHTGRLASVTRKYSGQRYARVAKTVIEHFSYDTDASMH